MERNTDGTKRGGHTRPWGPYIAASLMIIFGLAEVATGFTHNFLGISASSAELFTFSAVVLGSFYVFAGLLVLTMKRLAAAIAIVLLGADVVGRIALVATGLYPLSSTENMIGIVAGTIIAALFAVYLGMKWDLFK